MLLGTFNHQLDQKNRFRIPAKFKSSLGDNIIITKGTGKCLFLFSPSDLETAVFEKAKSISLFDETAQKSLRLLMGSAHEAEVDNQGRMLLPASLKDHAEITKNIVFVGVGNRVEIWAEENWNNYSEGADFDAEMGKLKDYGV